MLSIQVVEISQKLDKLLNQANKKPSKEIDQCIEKMRQKLYETLDAEVIKEMEI